MGRKKQTKVWFDYLERSLYTPNCKFSSASPKGFDVSQGGKKRTKLWFDYLDKSLYTPNCNFSSAWRWYNHTFSRWSEMDLLSSSTIFNSSQTFLYSTLLFSHGYSTRNYTEWIRETWNLLKSSNGWKTHKLWNFAGGKGNIPHYTTLKHNSYGPLLHFAILSQTWTKKCEILHSALKVCISNL